MRWKSSLLVAGIGVLLVSTMPVQAHHSFAAEYDPLKPMTIKGTVVKMEWINPHAWIHVSVKNPDGTITEWMAEAGSPNALVRRGVTRESLPVGLEVTIQGFGAKDGSKMMNARDVKYPDGRRLFVGSSGTGAPDERSQK